jgi:two-component system nitrate/nitrite response regulator NarL
MIRVVVAEDHLLMRQEIIEQLRLVADVAVIGDASNGIEAVKRVTELSPDILLLDLVMPGMSGLEVLNCIHDFYPDLRVIVVSFHDSREFVLSALKRGAFGFISKDVLFEELESAIEEVSQGNLWLSPSVLDFLLYGGTDSDPDRLEDYDNKCGKPDRCKDKWFGK